MDIRTIKTFQTIVKTGSFQRAAEELQYVQSTITMHIQKLESNLGVKLLERGKKLQLTEAGRLLNENASLLLQNYESLHQTMADLVKGDAGVLRLGVMEPTASYRLPEILGPFMRQYPKVQFSIQIGTTFILSQMLDEGSIDLAICTTPETGLGQFFEPLFMENVGLLLPEFHPLVQKETIYLRDLKNESLLITNAVCPYRKKLEHSLLEKGGSPYYGIEIGNMASLKFYVQANFGIAVVPLITVTPVPEGTVLKKISDLDSGLITGILKKQDSSHFSSAIEKLIHVLRVGLLAL